MHTVLREVVKDRNTKEGPLDRVVLCYDGDVGGSGPQVPERVHASLEGAFRSGTDGSGTTPWTYETVSAGRWTVDDLPGAAPPLDVRAVVWLVPDGHPHDAVIPAQQCLERLVCAALAEVHPERAADVARWLDADPAAQFRSGTPGVYPKAHTWAHMAKWGADHGCDDFFRALWREPPVADALRRLLADVWPHLEACAHPSA